MNEESNQRPDARPLYPISRLHLASMSDDLGLWQHAQGSAPNPGFGYCTDDVARAIVVDLLHFREGDTAELDRSIRRSLRFVSDGFVAATGRFLNMRTADGVWLENEASEDCHARTLVALAAVMNEMPSTELAERAESLFERALPAAASFGAIRSQSGAIIACDSAIAAGFPADETLESLTADLASSFGEETGAGGTQPFPQAGRGPVMLHARGRDEHSGLYGQTGNQGPHGRREAALAEWLWPDQLLTYENAIVPRALIAAGVRLARPALVERGCAVLDWLIDVQTADSGIFTPIGNSNWWRRGNQPSQFDQQPIEAATTLAAAVCAFGATGRERYLDAAESAYGWFLGDNDLGIAMADPVRGACFDGLMPAGPNENQGAESTLMWLTALEQMRQLRRETESVASRRAHS